MTHAFPAEQGRFAFSAFPARPSAADHTTWNSGVTRFFRVLAVEKGSEQRGQPTWVEALAGAENLAGISGGGAAFAGSSGGRTLRRNH
jgi:hypothetical protein